MWEFFERSMHLINTWKSLENDLNDCQSEIEMTKKRMRYILGINRHKHIKILSFTVSWELSGG